MAQSASPKEKAPKAERDAAAAAIVELLQSPLGKSLPYPDVIAWRRLLTGVRNNDFSSHDLVGIHDVIERTKFSERFAKSTDEWKLTHPRMLHNGGQLLAYYLMNEAQGDVVRLVNHDSGVTWEIVRESSHFTKEQVQSVFCSIVQSKTGLVSEQTVMAKEPAAGRPTTEK